jgi:HEAT repeat protein
MHLIKSFEAAKSNERIRMAATLGHMKNSKTTDALILAFDIKRGNPKESAAYIEALGIAGDTCAVEPLVAAGDYLRSLILPMGELPGRLQVKDAVPALQQLASGARGNLLQAIFEALGEIGDKRAMPTLEQAFNNPDKFIEVQVAYALVKLGRKDMVIGLQRFLDGDPEEDKVGLLAAYYLVKLDKDAGLRYLEKMMKKPDSVLAPIAADTLGKTENPRAVLVLIEAFKAPDSTVRLTVARSLGHLGGARAITALKKMRSDPHPGVRAAAINGLADLGEVN